MKGWSRARWTAPSAAAGPAVCAGAGGAQPAAAKKPGRNQAGRRGPGGRLCVWQRPAASAPRECRGLTVSSRSLTLRFRSSASVAMRTRRWRRSRNAAGGNIQAPHLRILRLEGRAIPGVPEPGREPTWSTGWPAPRTATTLASGPARRLRRSSAHSTAVGLTTGGDLRPDAPGPRRSGTRRSATGRGSAAGCRGNPRGARRLRPHRRRRQRADLPRVVGGRHGGRHLVARPPRRDEPPP